MIAKTAIYKYWKKSFLIHLNFLGLLSQTWINNWIAVGQAKMLKEHSGQEWDVGNIVQGL